MNPRPVSQANAPRIAMVARMTTSPRGIEAGRRTRPRIEENNPRIESEEETPKTFAEVREATEARLRLDPVAHHSNVMFRLEQTEKEVRFLRHSVDEEALKLKRKLTIANQEAERQKKRAEYAKQQYAKQGASMKEKADQAKVEVRGMIADLDRSRKRSALVCCIALGPSNCHGLPLEDGDEESADIDFNQMTKPPSLPSWDLTSFGSHDEPLMTDAPGHEPVKMWVLPCGCLLCNKCHKRLGDQQRKKALEAQARGATEILDQMRFSTIGEYTAEHPLKMRCPHCRETYVSPTKSTDIFNTFTPACRAVYPRKVAREYEDSGERYITTLRRVHRRASELLEKMIASQGENEMMR
eukprot:SAG31_NODE_4227_length_3444_cov_20.637668_2_plen_355_part_00